MLALGCARASDSNDKSPVASSGGAGTGGAFATTASAGAEGGTSAANGVVVASGGAPASGTSTSSTGGGAGLGVTVTRRMHSTIRRPRTGTRSGRGLSVESTSDWGAAVTGAFGTGAQPSTVTFTAKAGRYIRFRALSEVTGKPYTSVAELDVAGTPL
jgi:hypothetical protein